MELNDISGAVVNSAMLVHSELGPGLLEEPYKQCLAYELISRGFKVDIEPELPIIYRGVRINVGYRLDLLVDDAVIVELKAVKEIAPIHRAQLLTYLKLSKKHLGLILNFNTVHLKDGIVRIVNNLPPASSPSPVVQI
jgi:GxxExxY protein